jgi:two-component system cell cycle sensor histidine kinase PleC
MRRSADVRALKSQLDALADVVHSSRIVGPGWAAILTLFGSAAFGFLGSRPLLKAALFPATIGAVTWFAERCMEGYRADTGAHFNAEKLWRWFPRFVGIQILLGLGWGLLPWMLWDASNGANHIFLWACAICAMASVIVNRANHWEMLVASLTPLVLLSSLRFATSGAVLDAALAVMLPGCAALLFFDGRRMARQLDQDSRLRFEVEDLAHELEEARDEALRKRSEAEAANASKTVFLAHMSHELRTPLNAILGFSEIIAEQHFGRESADRYAEYAADIHASGAHLLSLINDLLDIAKIEAGRMEISPRVLDARATFETALRITRLKARERQQNLTIDVNPSAPVLFADARALKQILINLVSNAVKFTPIGGTILVSGSRIANGGFQIAVEDDGPGIPPDKLARIFRPFSRADNRYGRQEGGTGLGLALVRGLAELHGGRAWIESDPGRGCCVYVVLPAASNATDGQTTGVMQNVINTAA